MLISGLSNPEFLAGFTASAIYSGVVQVIEWANVVVFVAILYAIGRL